MDKPIDPPLPMQAKAIILHGEIEDPWLPDDPLCSSCRAFHTAPARRVRGRSFLHLG